MEMTETLPPELEVDEDQLAELLDQVDEAPEYTPTDLYHTQIRLQKLWGCSPSNVARKARRRLLNTKRVKRPRKPAPSKRAALRLKQKKQRQASQKTN